MSEQNLLRRHLAPAGKKLGIKINWLILRRSFLNWTGDAGADPKDMQAQMGHSRNSTTMDVYRQFHREGQRRAANLLAEFVTNRVTLLSQKRAQENGQSDPQVPTIQ